MTRNPLHEVAIVGAYNTRQARTLDGETDLSIIHDAVQGVPGMAGLSQGDVDGVNIHTMRGGLSARNGVHILGGHA